MNKAAKQRISEISKQLSPGDRHRLINMANNFDGQLLRFTEAMVEQKRGKREKRSQQRSRPVMDDWRIG